jgi:toxin ParE1/3/4
LIYRVLFRPAAAEDLEALYDHIAKDSPANAIAYVRRLRAYCEKLDLFPQRGTVRQSLPPGLRIVGFERRAIIAYRVEGETVVILRILYGGRDLAMAFVDES